MFKFLTLSILIAIIIAILIIFPYIMSIEHDKTSEDDNDWNFTDDRQDK